MRVTRTIRPILILGVFVLGTSLGACRRADKPPMGDTEAAGEHTGEEAPAVLHLEPDTAAIAGIKTESAQFRALSFPVRATGTVSFNQKTQAFVTARVSGRIEELVVFPGERVKAGQKLLSLYSPDFLAAQAEYIQMTERLKWTSDSNDADAEDVARRMAESAAGKLKLMGLTEAEVRSLGESQRPSLLLAANAPFDSDIIESRAVHGDYVEMGQELFQIADLSTLWVLVDIYEKDLGRIRPGLEAHVSVDAFPGEIFPGRLSILGATLDKETRTVKVRLEVRNPSGKLKPGMYTAVTILTRVEETVLAVPETAVRDVEGRNVVFVAEADHTFAVREVKTGRRYPGFVEILEGLKEGEVYVTEGSFSLKSELLKKSIVGEHEHD